MSKLKQPDHVFPEGFVDEILALLDRIEIDHDPSLARQRFDIAEKYGYTVEFGEIISGLKH